MSTAQTDQISNLPSGIFYYTDIYIQVFIEVIRKIDNV